MSLFSLPDIAGMVLLMAVLFRLRTRYPDQRVDLWMLGLLFVLVESVAVAVLRIDSRLYSAMHAVALDSYVLAAVAFAWAARRENSDNFDLPDLLLPATPILVMDTLYGLNVVLREPYLIIAGLTLAGGVVYLLFAHAFSRRTRAYLLSLHLLIWVPVLWTAWLHELRWMVYWALACLYLLLGYACRRPLARTLAGAQVMTFGFIVWALCFLAHPLARGHQPYDAVLSNIWDMQKFLVMIGMLLVLLEDQTRRREEEALHDPLTGLPNRRLFEDRLAQAFARSRRTGLSAVLFTLDLNGFKAINDTQGHKRGDQVLQRTAERLRLTVRGADTLARCGGDEFCVIVNDIARPEDAESIVLQLRQAVLETTLPDGRPLGLSASIGYAVFPLDTEDAQALTELADVRMYEDKRAVVVVSQAQRVASRVLVS